MASLPLFTFVVLAVLTVHGSWMTWNFNSSVRPCDNFYNYVCPYNVVDTRTKRSAPEITTEEIMESIKEELQRLCVDDHPNELLTKICPRRSDCEEIEGGACETIEHKSRKLTEYYVTRGIEDKHFVYEELSETVNWWNTIVAEFESRMNTTLGELNEDLIAISKEVDVVIEEMLRKTSWKDSPTDPNPTLPSAATVGEQFLELLATTNSLFQTWTGKDLKQRINAIAKALEKSNREIVKLNATGILGNILLVRRTEYYINLFNSVLDFWDNKDVLQEDFDKMISMPDWNAHNDVNGTRRVVRFFEGLVLDAADTSIYQAWYANIAGVYGHETFHSFFGSSEKERATPVKGLQDQITCMENKAKEACEESKFGEQICMSGRVTWAEDTADLEGTRATIITYGRRFQSIMDNRVQSSDDERWSEFNYKQLFFIARAKLLCAKGRHHAHQISEGRFNEHSPGIIRINYVHSQMEEFHQAFNCKEGDKMFQKDICHAFGDQMYL